MRERYIPAIVMLIAGAITSILNIVNKIDPIQGLIRLLLILLLFFVVGMIIKAIIVKFIINAPKRGEASEDEDGVEEEEQEETTPEAIQPRGRQQGDMKK